jgi:cell wall-associated NlpC family hydrolase
MVTPIRQGAMKGCVILATFGKQLGLSTPLKASLSTALRASLMVGCLALSAVLGGCASGGTTATHVPTPKPFPMPDPANAKRDKTPPPPPVTGPEAPATAEAAPATPAPMAPAPIPGSPASRPTKALDTYALVGTALQLRGIPYVDGGASPRGFDCSGFTQYVFAQYGVRLPRSVEDQYRTGSRIDPKDLADGDLLFFATTSHDASHVGIVVGSDQFVHAPSSTGVVRVERLSADYWSRRFVGARRVR